MPGIYFVERMVWGKIPFGADGRTAASHPSGLEGNPHGEDGTSQAAGYPVSCAFCFSNLRHDSKELCLAPLVCRIRDSRSGQHHLCTTCVLLSDRGCKHDLRRSPSINLPCRQRRNLQSTLAAERKKVIVYCRREALKRRTKDIAAGAKEARKMKQHT